MAELGMCMCKMASVAVLAIAIWGAAATPFRMVVSFDELNQDTRLARGPRELLSKITRRNDAVDSL